MPVHDWTRVSAGTFHAFHTGWIAALQRALNAGALPEGYYALAEQRAGEIVPDVLTLQTAPPSNEANDERAVRSPGHGVALAEAPPAVTLSDTVSEAMLVAARARRLVIRHLTGDRIVAIVEIVSPGNKEKPGAVAAFVEKAVGALEEQVHLLLIDLLPPGADPNGIHGVLWDRLHGRHYELAAGKPLTLAAYRAAGAVTCYVEPLATGQPLPPMPLFLDPAHYIETPLGATYDDAYAGMPRHVQRVLEG